MANNTKKSKLGNLKQADGKVEFAPQTLEQLWGDRGEGVYDTTNINEYQESLAHMSLSDLQKHGAKFGLLPNNNRQILEGRLAKEFLKHFAKYRVSKAQQSEEKPVSKDILKIMAEGR